jgi:hypothetical protein
MASSATNGITSYTNNENLIYFELLSRKVIGQTVIRWSGEDVVLVSVSNNDSNLSPVVVNWSGKLKNLNQLQALLKELNTGSIVDESDYALRLWQENAKFEKKVEWSTKSESALQTEIRRRIEIFGHIACTEAISYWKWAKNAFGINHKNDAISLLKLGIKALGDKYQNEGLVDDTGMKLIIAEENFKNGKIDDSYWVYKRVLEARIQDYIRFYAPGNEIM